MKENSTFQWDKINKWSEELEVLHSIICKNQLLTPTVKWGTPVFTYKGKNIIAIAGFKNYFALWFYQGVFLKDEAKVLVNAQENVTKALRQWRFNSKEDINESLLLSYIAEAIENVDLGKAIKAEPKKIIIDALLEQVLKDDSLLNHHFLKFTPAKQNEFMEYVYTAKREATKWSRINKIKPMILAQKGLYDNYKK